jgi:hypothetical protein
MNDDIINKIQQQKLIEIVRQTIEQDNALREKYDVKNKFRFIPERLNALAAQLETHLQVTIQEAEQRQGITIESDEKIVYVYLFNAHGNLIHSWQNMLIPKVFYEYSVNRPIYAEKDDIESMIKAKSNRTQHGYLAIAIKELDILKVDEVSKDAYGNVIFKIREGSLRFDRVVSFVHNGIEYVVGEKGELLKKLQG